MATEREIKTVYCDNFFDLLELYHAMPDDTPKEFRKILRRQLEKAEARLTKEEAAAIRERVNEYLSD